MSCPLDLLGAVDGGVVLDAGCGNGRFTRILAAHLRSFDSIVGIDPDKESLDEARRETDDRRLSYRLLSVLDLKPEPPRFDTVVISNALHHVEDAKPVLDRLVSLLRPGGTIVVSEHYRDGLTPLQEIGRDVHHFKATVDELCGRVHRQTFRQDDIRKLVEGTGVRIESECTEAIEPAGPDDEETRMAIDFLDEYAAFVKGLAQEKELIDRLREIQARLRGNGIASAPNLCVIARRPLVD